MGHSGPSITESEMKKCVIGLLAVASLGLAACGGDKVSFDTLETARGVANENSKFNAQKWRAENGYEALGILSRGDSSQQADCPQGDGWASVDLIEPKSKAPQIKLKCSTVSANLGCWRDEDFKARAQLAAQENKCNPNLPANIKKIEN